MAVRVQIYYLWGGSGSMFLLLHGVRVCACSLRLTQGASDGVESVCSLSLAVAVAWQSGESGLYSTQNDVISILYHYDYGKIR
jgi:hypothetical protein